MATFLGTLFIVICVLLIVVILLQKGRGGGLGAAFGGAGSSAFGTRTGDVFTWVTIVLTSLFLLLAIAATFAFRPPKGVVAAPIFKPQPGEYTKRQYVSISCSTPDSKIYYTKDGSEPTKTPEQEYQGVVRVDPGTNLKSRAFRRRWTPSRIVEGYYGPAATQPAENEGYKPASEEPPISIPSAQGE